MNRVTMSLESCHGIKKLEYTFDFSKGSTYSIYAPNGSMKSSFASVFRDIAEQKESRDTVFPNRPYKREVKDELGAELLSGSVLAVRPYSTVFGDNTKTATLLVDEPLRQEYTDLFRDINKAKERLLSALKQQSGSKKGNLEAEISSAFMKSDNQFHEALVRIKDELAKQKDAPFKDIKYDTIFDDKVLEALGKSDVKAVISDYVKKYNQLLAASTYFRKGIFNYHQASTIAKSLADNGFFDAKHSLLLNANKKIEVICQAQLELIIQVEKDSITKDKTLKKQFAELDRVLYKNAPVREFLGYLEQDESILPQLGNINLFREVVWKSYLKANAVLYEEYLSTYQRAEARKHNVEESARNQRTQWEEVINIFNDRFFVPFKLVVTNHMEAVLGEEILELGFSFCDSGESAAIERTELLNVLSTGEAKALYVLDLIFETQVRKKAGIETLLIIDDIADSFDYKNKYAIIEYLREISHDPAFKQIILTHNFDFFRTLESRQVAPYNNCLMVLKEDSGLTLKKATGFRNVFVNDWKDSFFEDAKKRIASIAFLRNMLEYMKGREDPDYMTLTSLLHLKEGSAAITQADLDKIFKAMFGGTKQFADQAGAVIPWIHEEAKHCLGAVSGINLENKIVLSIAIRLSAEKYMIDKISDPATVAKITSNQTTCLLNLYLSAYPTEIKARKLMEKVVLMTPENIHLNSFMYEPILDMSDEHLKKLYREVCTLKVS